MIRKPSHAAVHLLSYDFAKEITWSLCEKDWKSVPLLLRAYEVSFFLLQELFRCTWVMAPTAPPGFPPSSKVGLIQRRHWSRLFRRVNPVAKFIVPDWGDKVDSGIGLSYRHARLHRLADLYDNPIPESTLSPQWWTMNFATVLYRYVLRMMTKN